MHDTLQVKSPYDQSTIQEIPLVGKDEVETALQTAYELSLDRSKWIPAHQRISILNKVASIMESKVEALTNRAAQEGGKPYKDSKVEVLRAINGVKLAAEFIPQLKGGAGAHGSHTVLGKSHCFYYQRTYWSGGIN